MNYFPEINALQKRPGYRICVKCVMDTTTQNINFDTKGVCNFCNLYETIRSSSWSVAKRESIRCDMIARMKQNGKGRDYDCLLGVSGGVDSSYMACQLKEWGLRVLAVHFDNGWNTELAVKNIELVCSKLGFDLHTHVVNWVEFRDLQLAFLRAGVANVEAPTDHGVFGTIFSAARKYRIRDIVTAVNFATEHTTTSGDYGWAYTDLRQLKDIHQRFSRSGLSTYPTLSYAKRLFLSNFVGLQIHQPLNMLNYDKPKAIEYLIKEIGWKPYPGKHGESIITRFHQSYILPKKFYKDKRTIHFSDMIRSGLSTRENAMADLSQPPYDELQIKQDKVFVVKKLGITEAEFDAIISAPPRSYKDYANEELFYKLTPVLVKLKQKVRGFLTNN